MRNYAIEWKWAFIFIIMSLAWMVVEKLTGLHSTHIDKHYYLTNLFAIPAIWIYVLALKDKKNNFYKGTMSFKQGFITGLFITIIVACLSPITQWIITYVISPEYFPNVIEYSVKTGYHATRAEAEAFFNYKNYAVQSIFGALIMGIITSLIVAFFSKTKKE
jgi:hypothetical protein